MTILTANLLTDSHEALIAAKELLDQAQAGLAARLAPQGKINSAKLDQDQFAAHGLAWLATVVEALAQMQDWAQRLSGHGHFGELEQLILTAAFGEYLAQIEGGIPMNQSEFVRPHDLGIEDLPLSFRGAAISRLKRLGTSTVTRHRIAELIADGEHFGDPGFEDDMLPLIRDQFRRFADQEIAPFAHGWHLRDELIPMSVVTQMAELGVFGLTIPENYGGLGMGKLAMCVVTEELSRAYIGVGSLGTRSEIAAELIRLGGTEEQKQYYLPKLASGEILPTAVFTEPDTGSDLGSLRTRAVKRDGDYRITGNKTWITHAARSDLMTLLVRTDPATSDWRGLSMLLAEKPRGSDSDPFPAAGMSGGEIKVLGYRGMKEYELAFDQFIVPVDHLLGGHEGEGFKQLMATFESARVQTAARAVGVAQAALDCALSYAQDRKQFGRPIYAFPRVSGKLAWMAVETMIIRQLTYFAARQKDSDRRCDIEAGMAKLLAARVAWSNADNALQIHGGNGYAEEYAISRILCDARILNIFEGAAEIQAQVVARGLLAPRN